ncbi:glycosyltransferase family 4 protein [Pseudomonas putida]|uniref:glycosyltransferase family 4 protein n=1 Tax=Pseudomonas putida TaxID=303 RepID=UPI0015756B32|nr:glycosyltransferase family 4 protein [Pseudomonas putida]NTY91290.1 glycosyltransferase family 4 protein [Pseudomonas putida]NTZ00391.1 glycosyltransferase family 4 protein [Pseudomonas putida]NTZ24959.1 glycosyltransferase family 4 protein [Pseudomonas putida]NTZ55153.1 glycosyltransferase family 4 protein [Pseudomonas putida]NTZ68096.1 glycosyltransferase family 4 protein [Pseudomonas putida]
MSNGQRIGKQKQMHCAHLLNDYSGSPRILGQTITALQDRGNSCSLYVGCSGPGVLDELDVPVYKYTYRRFGNRWLTLLAYLWSQVALFFVLVRRLSPGAVILVNTMMPFGAALAGKIRGATVVYHLHETSIKPAVLKKFLRGVIGLCAKKVIYVSKYLQQFDAIEGVASITVYNGLAESLQRQAVNTAYQHMHHGQFEVLMLASLKSYKGVNEFLGLASAMVDAPRVKFTLVLSASQAEVDEYFKNMAIPQNLVLHPATSDVMRFYSNASLVVNLSRVDSCVETFGLTILEAMAFGIPTIVPPVGGPVELVSDGVEGYQIDSKNRQQLVRTVARLSQDPQLCQALSERARMKASEFSTANFQKNIVMVFDDL